MGTAGHKTVREYPLRDIRDWISNTISPELQTEYTHLAFQHSKALERLYKLDKAHEELIQKYNDMESEIYSFMLTPPVGSEPAIGYDRESMSTVVRVDWFMPRLSQMVSTQALAVYSNAGEFPRILETMKRHFMEDVAPTIWKEAEHNLYRIATQENKL